MDNLQGAPTADGLTLRPVRLATTPGDEDGQLVFTPEGLIVAILVLIDPAMEDADLAAGSWFLETGFGPCQTACPPIFAGLHDARLWISAQVKTSIFSGPS